MAKRLQNAWLLILALLCQQPGSSVAEERLHFQQNAIDVSTTQYGGFLVDRDGFVWIGTTGYAALRHDGYELKSFASSIPGAMISSIVEDRDGDIWFSSFSRGITRYDKAKGEFTSYQHDPKDANSLNSNTISFSPQKLCVDKSNRLWIGTDEAGLCEFDKTTGTFRRHQHDPHDSNSLNDNAVVSVAEGSDNTIWVGTQSGGLNKYDRRTGKWKHYKHDPDDMRSLSHNWVNSILEDREGVLWVGTKKGGLNKLNKETSTFTRYMHDPDDPQSIGGDEVWSMHEDHWGLIWVCHIASPTSGLERFDKKTGLFQRYTHDPNDASTVSSNSISRVYEHHPTQTVWVVNYDGGIDRHDANTTVFQHLSGNPTLPNRLSDQSVLPIIEDRDGAIWVGTFAGGLNRVDPGSGEISHYQPARDAPTSLPRSRVTSLCEDRSGILWIGFWDGILAKFDRDTRKIIRSYEHDSSDPNSITDSERLKYIHEDKDDPNILWLATIKGGLDKFDKQRETFTHFKRSTDGAPGLSHNSIVTLYDDGEGVLWIPTYGSGLDKLDKKSGTFTNYRHEADNPNSLRSDTLYEIIETSQGEFWIARKGGVSHFDPITEVFTNFDKDSDGGPFGPVGSLLEDDSGNLWLASVGRGLVRFNTRTKETKRIGVEDGLQGSTFYWTSRLKDRNGRLWFGGSNGIINFDPAVIKENPLVPSIVLTAFTQGGSPVDTGTAPENLKEVTLDWRQNYFEFQFSALNFNSPTRNQYAYMLEGWDEQWYYSKSLPIGRYSGLSGGKYTLRLKGSNNDGVWNDEGTSITVFVTPPFWETAWFYLLVVTLGCSFAVAVVFHFKTIRDEIAERLRIEEALREAQELVVIRKEHEKELAEAQLAFVREELIKKTRLATLGQLTATVSHEIRNPLGTIRAALYSVGHVVRGQTDRVDNALERAERNIVRCDEIIEELLDYTRTKEVRLEPTNIESWLSEILDEQQISQNIVVTQDYAVADDLVIDQELLRRCVVNLITNACDAMDQTEACLTVNTIVEDDRFLIRINDTGCGIGKEDMDRIFEALYTTKGFGVGLGLSIVEQIMAQLNGGVSIQSKQGQGTTATLWLPLPTKTKNT